MDAGFRQSMSRDFHRLQNQYDALEGPLRAAADALNAAKAVYESLQLEYETVGEQRQLVRQQLLRATVSALPSELLRAIFLQLILRLQEEKEVDRFLMASSYNAQRFIVPFRLSAVCKKWRLVCMEFSALWSYIGIPDHQHVIEPSGHNYVKRTLLLLERSRGSPLHVDLRCPRKYSPAKSGWFMHVLIEVTKHVHRWRDIHISIPNLKDDSEAISFLRDPMPMLEFLSIASSIGENLPWRSAVYLPYSPCIRSLEFCSMFFKPVAPLTTLSSFHVSITNDSYVHLWSTLEMLPNLEDLSVDFVDEIELVSNFSKVITLPSLTRLQLQGLFDIVEEWSNYLELPRIRVLVILADEQELVDSIISFIVAKCASLVELRLNGDNDANISASIFVPLIGALSQLQVLRLCRWNFYNDRFFSMLSSKLATRDSTSGRIALRDLQLESVILSPEASDALCNLVRKQNAEGSQLSVIISNTPIEYHGIPSWAHRQLGILLGDKYVNESPDDELPKKK